MRLLNWINSQSKPQEVKRDLKRLLGRSDSTITSYVYGYRKVPEYLADQIESFTNGGVTKADLKEQFRDFQTSNRFAFAPMKGQRIDKPLLTISMKPSNSEFDAFVASVKDVLEVANA